MIYQIDLLALVSVCSTSSFMILPKSMVKLFKNLTYTLVLAVLLSAGCRDSSIPSDLPKLSSGTVVVTQEGAPVEGATVYFLPADGTTKWAPGGKTDESGAAKIYTNGLYNGAPPGKYQVYMRKTEVEPSKYPLPPTVDTPEYEKWLETYGDQIANEKRATYSLIEKIYTNAKSSPLEIEVLPGKAFTQEFDVGKNVKEKL